MNTVTVKTLEKPNVSVTRQLALIPGLAVIGAISTAHADTLNWDATGTADFNASSSWNPAQAPTGSDDLVYDLTGSRTVTFAADGFSNTVDFNNGTITVQPGTNTLDVAGGLDVSIADDPAKATAVTLDGGSYSVGGQTRVGVFDDDDGNSLLLDNGASFTSSFSATNSIVVRDGANNAIVLRSNSSIDAVRGFDLGVLANANSNSLSIESGSTATINAATVGDGRILVSGNTNNNSLTVTGTGSTLTTNDDRLALNSFASSTSVSGNVITVSDNGTVDATSASIRVTGTGGGNDLRVTSGGTLNVKDIFHRRSGNEFLVDGGTVNLKGGTGLRTLDGGEIDFKGGTIKTDVSNNENSSAWVVGDGSGDTATYELDGGNHDFGNSEFAMANHFLIAINESVSLDTIKCVASAMHEVEEMFRV